MEEISLEEKVKLLEEKVEKLEKIEKRRQRIKWIKITLKIIFYVAIIASLYFGYRYLKKNYIEPMDNFKSGIKTNIDGIKNYDYKSLFDGLFN
jgi:hypothetical protein